MGFKLTTLNFLNSSKTVIILYTLIVAHLLGKVLDNRLHMLPNKLILS